MRRAHRTAPADIRQVRSAVLRWYRTHGRTLPWRSTHDPYRILLSEIMLQQTQVHRVVRVYPRFLAQFPTLRSLARAQQRDVVMAWRGMGYNNRAVRLHRLSGIVTREYGGRFPGDLKTLLKLPGIGRYTAHAILAFAFRRPVPVVDVNIRRFLSRRFWTMQTAMVTRREAEIWKIAESALPRTRAYDWNQALMDLGAAICTARTPACAVCPVRRGCLSAPFMHRRMAPRRRIEPSFAGIPNRIYRGRIIEELRSNGGSPLMIGTLGRRIFPGYSPRHRRWLASILQSLAKDGLVRLSASGQHVPQKIRLA